MMNEKDKSVSEEYFTLINLVNKTFSKQRKQPEIKLQILLTSLQVIIGGTYIISHRIL